MERSRAKEPESSEPIAGEPRQRRRAGPARESPAKSDAPKGVQRPLQRCCIRETEHGDGSKRRWRCSVAPGRARGGVGRARLARTLAPGEPVRARGRLTSLPNPTEHPREPPDMVRLAAPSPHLPLVADPTYRFSRAGKGPEEDGKGYVPAQSRIRAPADLSSLAGRLDKWCACLRSLHTALRAPRC